MAIMIQLKDNEGRILYEVEKSEIFFDYRAVLDKAIATGVNLGDLNLKGHNLDGLVWKGLRATSLSFTQCSLRKNKFKDCEIEFFFWMLQTGL